LVSKVNTTSFPAVAGVDSSSYSRMTLLFALTSTTEVPVRVPIEPESWLSMEASIPDTPIRSSREYPRASLDKIVSSSDMRPK